VLVALSLEYTAGLPLSHPPLYTTVCIGLVFPIPLHG